MGNAGAGFAQGYASTWAQLLPIVEQGRRHGEDLKLRRTLADAELKTHNARTEILTRKAESMTRLQDAMLNGFEMPGNLEAGDAPSHQPFDMSNPAHQSRILPDLAIADPSGFTSIVRDRMKPPRPSLEEQITGAQRILGALNGGAAPAALPTPGQPDFAPEHSALYRPPGAPGTSGVAPGAAGVPGMAPPSAGAPAPRMQMRPTVNFDKEGNVTLSFSGQPETFQIQHSTVFDDATGRAQIVERIFSPSTGRVVSSYPIGQAAPPEALQRASEAAIGMGVPRGSALHGTTTSQLAYAALLPAQEQAAFLAQIERNVRGILGPMPSPGAMPAPGMPSAPTAPRGTTAPGTTAPTMAAPSVSQAIQDVTTTEAARVEARKRAEMRVPERVSDTRRREMSQELSTADLYGRIAADYEPDFVGKMRGTVAAKLYEGIGIMSPKEQRFRTNVNAANNQMIRDMSGAAVSGSEEARMIAQMPDPSLPGSMFQARLVQTRINQKIIAIRRRQVDEATGLDVSTAPKISLTATEQRAVAAPIVVDYQTGQIDRAEARRQLMGLAQLSPTGVEVFLSTIDKAKGRR